MADYSELVDTLLIFGECRMNSSEAARMYAERFPGREQPSRFAFPRLVRRAITVHYIQGTGILTDKKGTSLVYEGQLVNGKRHGLGTLYKTNPKGERSLFYDGGFEKGVPSGIGVLHLDEDNSDYFGDVRCGKRHGYGKAWYTDGSFYLGAWVKGKREGQGLCVYSNDNCYEGCWFNDSPHGYGVFFSFSKGLLQEGVWVEGICKTSSIKIIDYRQSALQPIAYPIPKVMLLHYESVFNHWERQAEDIANFVKWKITGERILNKMKGPET